MYSKGPLICRNISIQNRQMLLRVFNFIEQKSRILREKKTEEKKESKSEKRKRIYRKNSKSTPVDFFHVVRSNAHERK